MTKTVCDRCGQESDVLKVNFSAGDMTERACDLCEQCLRVVKGAFAPPPKPPHRPYVSEEPPNQ